MGFVVGLQGSTCAWVIDLSLDVPLSCPTGNDLRARTRFASSVGLKALKANVNVGNWRWSEDRPRPGWNALKSAPVWVEPGFESVRSVLSVAPKVVLKAAPDDRMPSAQLPEVKRTASIFNALEDTIPNAVDNAKPRGLIALVTTTENPLTASIMKHADITPLLLYGTKDCVQAALKQLETIQATHTFTINVFCRPENLLPSDRQKLQQREACLVANPATVLPQVCSGAGPGGGALAVGCT